MCEHDCIVSLLAPHCNAGIIPSSLRPGSRRHRQRHILAVAQTSMQNLPNLDNQFRQKQPQQATSRLAHSLSGMAAFADGASATCLCAKQVCACLCLQPVCTVRDVALTACILVARTRARPCARSYATARTCIWAYGAGLLIITRRTKKGSSRPWAFRLESAEVLVGTKNARQLAVHSVDGHLYLRTPQGGQRDAWVQAIAASAAALGHLLEQSEVMQRAAELEAAAETSRTLNQAAVERKVGASLSGSVMSFLVHSQACVDKTQLCSVRSLRLVLHLLSLLSK